MIDTSPSEDDATGPLHQGVAELVATRSVVTRAQEYMVTKGIHGYLAAWAYEIHTKHMHTQVISQESTEVASCLRPTTAWESVQPEANDGCPALVDNSIHHKTEAQERA